MTKQIRIVVLKGGSLDIVDAAGKTMKTLQWETERPIGSTRIRWANSTAT